MDGKSSSNTILLLWYVDKHVLPVSSEAALSEWDVREEKLCSTLDVNNNNFTAPRALKSFMTS